MITDLTVGKPSKILWRFTLPMLISIIFQQMYNMADSIIAGNFIGDTAIAKENSLAAVGASFAVTMLFVQIANGINAGCAVVISQLFGAKKYENMKTAVTTAIVSTAVIAIVMSVFGTLFCGNILRALNTPESIMIDAKIYLDIYMYGLLFLFIYNVCTGIFTALGDSKTPLVFLIASSVGNVLLNLYMVIVLDMGMAGIAWATFISQGISSILALIWLRKRLRAIKTESKPQFFSPKMLLTIGRISIPTIFQLSFVSVGNLFVQSIINEMGDAVLAGYSATTKLNSFAISCIVVMSNGLSAFTAQNIGAGKTDRVPEGYKVTVKFSFITFIPFLFLFMLFANQMITLFTPTPTTEALDAGRTFLYLITPFYSILIFKIVSDAVLKGAGSMRQFMITTFVDLILRVGLSFALAPSLGFLGVCIAWPIGWLIGTTISVIFYAKGTWKRIGLNW